MRLRHFVPLLFLSSLAQADGTFTLDQKSSSLTFHLVHKLHKFEVRAKKLEGKARLAGGQVQVMVRAPVEGFDSANVNRDEHMKEILEAVRFPTVETKAVGALAEPAATPSTVEVPLTLQISLHGVTKTLAVPATVAFESAARAVGTFHFAVSLDSFQVERPSLMFVKMEDAVQIDGSLVFTR
jgi:hypothetical protein